jgi:acetyltransferase-like isoleucine patch superfamily enzyme
MYKLYQKNVFYLIQYKNTMQNNIMSVGKYSYSQYDSPIIHWENDDVKLVVGKFCSIAGNVNIYLGGNHRIDWVTTYPFGHIHRDTFNNFDGQGHPSTKGDVIIGNDVWIGDNVTIMSGVRIGDGVVIANNSHVVKNVEPYSLVGGNPAKLIKYRFTQEQITQLLQIRWWDWDDEKINTFTHLLCNNNIDEFIKVAIDNNNGFIVNK